MEKGVRKLYLNDNNITEEGAMYLAEALKSNHTVWRHQATPIHA